MKQVFKEDSVEQGEFVAAVQVYTSFSRIVSERVDCTSPDQILSYFSVINSMLAGAAHHKAKLDELTDKLCVKNMMTLNVEPMSDTERKVKLAFSIGDCSFYKVAMELLMISAYAKIDMLKYSLQYHNK